MPFGAKHKLGGAGVHLLMAIGVLAVLTAFLAIPMIAEATGISRSTVTYSVAAVCFVAAVVTTRWAKALNNKNAAEGK